MTQNYSKLSKQFITEHWYNLHRVLIHGSSRVDKFRFMMWLSTLAFAKDANMQVLQTLASFFLLSSMSQFSLPQSDMFLLHRGRFVNTGELRHIVQSARLQYYRCPEATLSSHPGESKQALQRRRQAVFQRNQNRALDKLVNTIEQQFPREVPVTPDRISSVDTATYIDVAKVLQEARPKFNTWFDNHLFYIYLGDLAVYLRAHTGSPMQISPFPFTLPSLRSVRRHGFVSIDDILNCSAYPVFCLNTMNTSSILSLTSENSAHKTTPRLTTLIDHLEDQATSQ